MPPNVCVVCGEPAYRKFTGRWVCSVKHENKIFLHKLAGGEYAAERASEGIKQMIFSILNMK